MPKARKAASRILKRTKRSLAAINRWKRKRASMHTVERNISSDSNDDTNIPIHSNNNREVNDSSDNISETSLVPLETVWESTDKNMLRPSTVDPYGPSTSKQTINPITSRCFEDQDIGINEPWGTQDKFDRIMEHELCVEVDNTRKDMLSGNRIVDINYVISKVIEYTRIHTLKCTSSRLDIVEEKKVSLVSTILLECAMCHRKYEIRTQKPQIVHKDALINVAAVWGTLATGSTFSHLEEFLSVLNIPPMSNNVYYQIQEQLSTSWMESSILDMEKAATKEREIAIQLNQVDEDGVPWITVYLDGGWSKRSYGHNYNAASGVAIIIGKATGKVIFMGVRNKFCIICTKAENKNQSPRTHTCFKNWTGSSGAMEADIIVEGFRCSETHYGIRYKQFIADGDSSVFKKIKDRVSYGNQVKKIECTNHVIKNHGKRLYNLKNSVNSVISPAAKKLLTGEKIKALQSISQKAIYDNAHGDIATLIEDLDNGIMHVYDHHEKCKDYYCKFVGTIENSKLSELKSTGLIRHLQGSLNLVIRKASNLIDNETNNRAELFMSILTRFNMGKRLNLIQRNSFQTRSYVTAMRYNKGVNWHHSPWKNATGMSPGVHFKKYITKSCAQAKKRLQYKSTTKTKKTMKRKTVKNIDYGPNALQPTLTDEAVNEECLRIISKLNYTPEEIETIANETIGQFSNVSYIMHRKDKLTASNFGDVIRRMPHTSCHSLVKKILKTSNISSTAIEYGKANESVAISLFEELSGFKVKKSGLWLDKIYPFLGASPDGLIDKDAIIEVKCLYKISRLGISLNDAAKTMKSLCLEEHLGLLRLKRNHNYYFQVQGQLHITGRTRCHFVVYVNDILPLHVEIIQRDDDFWNDIMEKKLTDFYRFCILPETVRNNLDKGLKCVDPEYIKKAQEDKIQNK